MLLPVNWNKQNPVHLFAEQKTNILSLLLRIVCRVTDQQTVSGRSQGFTDVTEERAVEQALNVIDDHADGSCLFGSQPSRNFVYFIPELINGFLYPDSVLRKHIPAIEILRDCCQ